MNRIAFLVGAYTTLVNSKRMRLIKLAENISGTKIFIIVYLLLVIVTVDTSIVKISAFIGSFYYVQDFYNGLFILVVATVGLVQFVILRAINSRSGVSSMQNRLNLKIWNRVVVYASYAILAILVSIILEMYLTSSYTLIFVFATIWISYSLSSIMLGLLSYVLFRWLKQARSLVVLAYSIAILILCVNAIVTIIFMSIELGDPRSIIYPSASPVGGLNISSLTLDSLYNITLIGSFLLTWSATVILLNYYSRIIGRAKYWVLVSIPLIYFLSSFQPLFVDIFPQFRQANPILYGLVYTTIFSAAKPVGAVLFGVAFWMLSRKLENAMLKNYMLICSIGMIILFSANQPIGLLLTPYPPFGLMTISLVGLSSFFVLIGIYSSAISVSQDSKLRQSIRDIALKETRFLDSIGMAQMEQEIQRKAIALTEVTQDKMLEETGIDSSLTEQDVKEYLDQVIEEVKKSTQAEK